MANITVGYAAALIVLGVLGYLLTAMISVTALIPAFFGLVLLALGVWARRPEHRKTAIHIALVVALLGLLGTARGAIDLGRLLSGQAFARPAAVWSRAIMAVLSAAFLSVAIRSFIRARRGPP